jgi:hypothetical protein
VGERLAPVAGVAGDGGDGDQFDLRVAQGESEGQGVVDVRADVGVEEDAAGYGYGCLQTAFARPALITFCRDAIVVRLEWACPTAVPLFSNCGAMRTGILDSP